tara:strand:+ start:2403 stop:2777 length:375 start_codon:yes stop_codon:yes gene_type:complete
MSKTTYSTIPQIGPARFVPQVLGGLAGGVGGFLKARKEAKAAGEKLTFKDAIGDIAMGAGKGALNPLSGAVGLVTQGVGNIAQDKAMRDDQMSQMDDVYQNSSINQNPVFDPLAAATMRGLYKT